MNMNLFTFTLHCFACWGVLTPTVLPKLPVWLQLLFPLAGCCLCSREHKQYDYTGRAVWKNALWCGQGFQALIWSKLLEVNSCIDCSLFWTRAWNALHMLLGGTGLSAERGRCFARSGAADFLGHLENVEWKWQVQVINVIWKGLCLHLVVLCCSWSQSRTTLCVEWYPNAEEEHIFCPYDSNHKGQCCLKPRHSEAFVILVSIPVMQKAKYNVLGRILWYF